MTKNATRDSIFAAAHLTRWLVLAGLVLTLGAGGILWYLSTQMQQHQVITAREDARTFASSVAQFRNFYTQEIVPRARKSGMHISPHYLHEDDALPLPATFILDFGQFMSEDQEGIAVNLYSDLPFPYRATDRSLDSFQTQALKALTETPDQVFYRVETLEGQRTLRFAAPDRMETACVQCHNSYPGSPRTDWKEGDLRGVIEIRRTLDNVGLGLHTGLLHAALLSALLILGLLAVMWLAMSRMAKGHQKLSASNKQLASMQERLNQQIFALNQHAIVSVANAEGNIIDANDKFCEISGYTKEELLGQNHRLVNSGYHSQTFFKNMWDTITAGRVWSGELRNQAKDGRYYWVSATLVPFVDQSGEPYQYIGIRTDITERKAFELEALNAKEAAEAANTAKSEFLANMSHEIRTPMNGIIGMSSLALESNKDEEREEYLEIVKDSAEALLTILNDILDFSKIEANKLQLEEVAFDLPALVQQIHKILAYRAEEKGLTLNLELDPQIPKHLIGDPTRLRQVIINLLGNAIKFTAQGSVSLNVKQVFLEEHSAGLHFAILDTGIGIEEHQLEAIFEAFSQADTSTTREFGGTGLGLSISSQLVALMGGKIQVHSQPNKGSCFEFTLSLGRTPGSKNQPDISLAQDSNTASKKQVEHQDPLNVLLIEDNAVNRKLASVLLAQQGCQVDVAENGQAGFTAFTKASGKALAYDLVIMDLQMPVMGGLEATQLIRAFERERHLAPVTIIAMTANAMEGDREACLNAGMTDYLSKPLRFKELKAKLDHYFGC